MACVNLIATSVLLMPLILRCKTDSLIPRRNIMPIYKASFSSKGISPNNYCLKFKPSLVWILCETRTLKIRRFKSFGLVKPGAFNEVIRGIAINATYNLILAKRTNQPEFLIWRFPKDRSKMSRMWRSKLGSTPLNSFIIH